MFAISWSIGNVAQPVPQILLALLRPPLQLFSIQFDGAFRLRRYISPSVMMSLP
jgi:hypothetical protein